MYFDTLQSVHGCDSVNVLTFTLVETTEWIDTLDVCDEFVFDDSLYTSSATIDWVGVNNAGCDSVVSLTLNVWNSSLETEVEESCDAFEWNGTWVDATGTYTQTMQTVHGCDSVTVWNSRCWRPSMTRFKSRLAMSILGTERLQCSGAYSWVGQTVNGCDSVVTLDLTLWESVESSGLWKAAHPCCGMDSTLTRQARITTRLPPSMDATAWCRWHSRFTPTPLSSCPMKHATSTLGTERLTMHRAPTTGLAKPCMDVTAR